MFLQVLTVEIPDRHDYEANVEPRSSFLSMSMMPKVNRLCRCRDYGVGYFVS